MNHDSGGRVSKLYVTQFAGQPMKSQRSVEARAGKGLVGDRYAEGLGAFSNSGNKIRHVSLIDLDAINVANINAGTSFHPSETRRNIVTKDVELNDLIDREFLIDGVRMIGRSLCDPCARPAKLIQTEEDFASAFTNSGGLRAEILSSGIIAVGAVVLLQ